MAHYRYKLEDHSGRQKHQCPDCKEQTFVYYVYSANNQPIDGLYCGKCERINNCTYHLKPSEYFQEYNVCPDEFQYNEDPEDDEKQHDYINRVSPGILKDSMLNPANSFTTFLLSYLNDDYETLMKLVRLYNLGTYSDSETPDQILFEKYDRKDAVIFWQVDINNECRDGKIMFYNDRGKRLERPYWMHCYYSQYQRKFKLEQCLYGEHLLNKFPDARNILIVESEKTAILLKHYFLPDPNVLVMASGSAQGLNPDKFRVFQDQEIYLLPDIGCESLWQDQAEKINNKLGLNIQVYPSQEFIEDYFNANFTLKPGEDIADYLITRQLGEEYR